MTTLDTLGDPAPDRLEVYRAALAMADFDGRFCDYEDALEWLSAAEGLFAPLPREYEVKRRAWLRRRQPNVLLVAALSKETRLPSASDLPPVPIRAVVPVG